MAIGNYNNSVDRVLALLKDQFGAGEFKAYFEGDPIAIGLSNLPCIIVEKVGSRITAANTAQDRLTETIQIKVVLNKKDDFGASDNINLTERKLRMLVEGRDDVNAYYLPQSLMGVLRANLTMGNSVVNQDMEIRYDMDIRPEELITSEAQVIVTIDELILVPTRV